MLDVDSVGCVPHSPHQDQINLHVPKIVGGLLRILIIHLKPPLDIKYTSAGSQRKNTHLRGDDRRLLEGNCLQY